MTELLQEALALYNLPLTALLVMVVFYWLLVLMGALDFDLEVPDFSDGGSAPPGMTLHDPSALSGTLAVAARFMGFGQVPIAIWGSFFVLFSWGASLILNYRFNGIAGDRSLAMAAWLLIPGGIISLLLTKLMTLPLAKFLAALAGSSTESIVIIGHTGVVASMGLDESYGQVEVNQGGAPALINARLPTAGPALQKGDRVRVIQALSEGSFYYVEPV